MNKLIPFLPKEQIVLKPKEQKVIKIEAPFVDKISGLAIVKILDRKAQNTIMLKLKFTWNLVVFDVTNSSLETVIFDLKEILDLSLMGYYKKNQGILQQNLSKYYRFESADILCEQFNRFINTLKREKKEESQEKYSWLAPDNEKKDMSDGEILQKYVDLDKTCMTDIEKKQVMDMLYKYKDTFSVRD